MNQSNFNVTVNGETVSISLAKARELCPNEVEKMKLTWNQASLAMQNQDVNGSIIASKEVEKMMKALVHALTMKLQQERQEQEWD